MHDNEKLEQRIQTLESQLSQMADKQRQACQIIHDMRTPLLTIHTVVNGQLNHAKELLVGYKVACEHQLVEKPLRSKTQQALEKSLVNVMKEFEVCHRDLDKILDLIADNPRYHPSEN